MVKTIKKDRSPVTPSVKSVAKKLIQENEYKKQQKIVKEKQDKLLAEQALERKASEELIQVFEKSFFSINSSNTKVAKVIADMNDYYVLTYSWGLIPYAHSSGFQNYLSKLKKKFDIEIRISRVKPDDYWSGSGDDLVYYAKPTELRITFGI
ncbi:MAG TPA: hypothetical protein VI911_07635 [Patescibacteria group bacterium]|nr:hypothetical protein [Patescibacteria group bacterium]